MAERPSDEWYMQQALLHAQKAADEGEVPIGAIIVDESGTIVGTGYNQVEKRGTQTAHAEMLALQDAAEKKGWRLENCLLYVTLEPCLMCNGAVRLSRLRGVVFGTRSNLFGCHLDNDFFVPLYKKSMSFVKEGVCEQQCKDILREFFKSRRKHGEHYERTKKRI